MAKCIDCGYQYILYNVHLVAVHALQAHHQDQLLPQATPFILVILGLELVQATQEFAAPVDRAPPLPPALSIFKDH